LGHKKKDPHQRLESLERWSARATIWILIGILVEIGAQLWFPHDPWERLWGIVANGAIGIGLAVEYVVIGRAIIAGREAQTESDEKIAASEARAGEAQLETEKLKAQFAWRFLPLAQISALTAELRKSSGSSIVIEYIGNDPEALYFAKQFWAAFRLAKWKVSLSGGTYSDLWFGLIVPQPEGETAATTVAVRNALTATGIGFNTAPLPRWANAVVSGDSGANAARIFIGPRQPPMPMQ
jgi:hypothetical protein